MQQENFILATEHERSVLGELDYLLCRNVEVFTASKEDVRDNTYNEGSCNVVFLGQVGLCCKHCSSSPFATARYAAIFPTNIIQMGSALRMIAKWHFPTCSMAPIDVRKRIDILLSKSEKSKRIHTRGEYESMSLLKAFLISTVMKRFKLENLPTCGIKVSNSRSTRSREFSQQLSTRRRNLEKIGQHEVCSGSSHNSLSHSSLRQYNTSLQHRTPPSLIKNNTHAHYLPISRQPQVIPVIDPIPLHSSNIHTSQQHMPSQFRAPNSLNPHFSPCNYSHTKYHQQPYTGTRMYLTPTQYNCNNLGATNLDDALRYLASASNYYSLLVLEEDRALLSDYFFYMVKQLQLCYFTESDRKIRGGKRDNIKVGFGGFECHHCSAADISSSRKFFWSNVDRLANSFAEVPIHVLNCKNCPQRIKTSLHTLKKNHPEQMADLPRGSQKIFFRRMWRRVHAGTKTEKEEGVVQDDSNSIATSTPISKGLESKLSLSIPQDKDWLSDIECFVRCNLEVFCASQDEVDSSKTPIHLGQVGIRCTHCAASQKGASGSAMNFPSSIDRIYEAVKEIQKLHLESCVNLPVDVFQELASLKTSTSLSSVSKRYYIIAAQDLGMVDTPEGIRIIKLWTGSSSSNQCKASSGTFSSMKETNRGKEQNTPKKRKSSCPLKDDSDVKKQNTS